MKRSAYRYMFEVTYSVASNERSVSHLGSIFYLLREKEYVRRMRCICSDRLLAGLFTVDVN